MFFLQLFATLMTNALIPDGRFDISQTVVVMEAVLPHSGASATVNPAKTFNWTTTMSRN